jgi:RHS repeat-associated protein
MKNYSVKNKNYCVNNEKYCVNKLIYCVNNFGFDIQTLGCAQLASPQGSLHFVNPYPDLCNLQGNAQETELFYYHPDHLGSTGMVTDNLSNITAGYLYAPFGEILQEHLAVDNRIPKYAFNAKELDEENGMYYYSARYYAPPTFISRDPMFEKYPSISPYTYCSNNPINRIDPSGEDDYGLDENTGRLSLIRKTKDEWDVVCTGSFNIRNVFTANDNDRISVSKGILNGTDKKEDISKRGFTTNDGKGVEGIELVKFISFNSHKEVSGYESNSNRKEDISASPWFGNKLDNSKVYEPKSRIGYKLEFRFHTHPGPLYVSGYGFGIPSPSDKKNASKFNIKSYIISKYEGAVPYSQFGKIPIGICAPLPESLSGRKQIF